MKQPKSMSQAEPDDPDTATANGGELDPLIDALLNHLPASGQPFPPEDRKLWMQILELILKLIHPDEASPPEPEPTPQQR